MSWDNNEIIIRSTKTGDRRVTLKPSFMMRLRAAHESSDSDHIITYHGNPIKTLGKSLKTAPKKAGIKKKVRLYDIRHLYGTLMAKNKADIFAIKILMGHSDIETTKRYLHHADGMKQDAVENCLPDLNFEKFSPQN
jgi:integrase